MDEHQTPGLKRCLSAGRRCPARALKDSLMINILIAFAVRCLLVGLFLPFSALDKVLNFKLAVEQASQAMPSRALAVFMITGGFCIEVLMSLAVLTGVADRLAALVLAAYCLVTALLWKQFWRKPDFRLSGTSKGREVFWDFLKNVALAGGFLLLAFGSNATDVGYFLRHPLASSHPYEMVGGGLQ
ncbi:MAG: DoxX family membrane protein, partial [Casimicrobiaceae bacterium]